MNRHCTSVQTPLKNAVKEVSPTIVTYLSHDCLSSCCLSGFARSDAKGTCLLLGIDGHAKCDALIRSSHSPDHCAWPHRERAQTRALLSDPDPHVPPVPWSALPRFTNRKPCAQCSVAVPQNLTNVFWGAKPNPAGLRDPSLYCTALWAPMALWHATLE